MVFIETEIFTNIITLLLNDDEYSKLQGHLADNPKVGDLIQHTGGLRKIRWSGSGRGKRGGIRTLYYYAESKDKIFMIYAYSKNKAENITDIQAKIFKSLIDNLKKELKTNGHKNI